MITMTQIMESSEKKDKSQDNQQDHQINETNNKMTKGDVVEDEHVLKFMDSLDAYLCLLDSLSSTLRQGWFDFASARYSMGASRVNSALLDLKEHPAATYLEVRKDEEPHFTLCKWTSFSAADSSELKDGDKGLQQESNCIRQRHKDTCQSDKEARSPVGGPSAIADDQVQKERSKSLAIFGKLVSPKLQSAQFSFETALETLIEIANVRASIRSAFDKVREH